MLAKGPHMADVYAVAVAVVLLIMAAMRQADQVRGTEGPEVGRCKCGVGMPLAPSLQNAAPPETPPQPRPKNLDVLAPDSTATYSVRKKDQLPF